jgi:GNAT superfamily N-acetyltransferase
MTSETPSIRPATADDREGWATLYRGYRDFYELDRDDAVIDRVWQWIQDESSGFDAFVAESDGGLVGLANYRRFLRPSRGTFGIFLDDLFTAPDSRGRGVGRAFLRELSTLAENEGASVVRWITSEGNASARSLYDAVATPIPFVTYDLTPGSL